jgi:competence protein ComEC
MRARMLAFCLAVIGVCYVPSLPAVPLAVFVVLGALCLWLCGRRFWVLGVLGAAGLGLCWGIGFGLHRLDALLPEPLEEVDFWVTGAVTGLPQRNGRVQQAAFRVEHSCLELVPSNCAPRNALFSPRLILLNYYGSATLEPGQRWRWRVRLNRPHGFANPGGFDYEGWLLMQGYAAKGYVRETALNRPLPAARQELDKLRFALRERLGRTLDGASHKGILLALIIGDREQISQEHWALFSATGTNHLIVISGLHVGFIAMLGYWFGNALARLWPSLLLRFPAQKCGALSALGAALAYSLLAGFSLPTQRALIMVAVFMAGRLFAQEPPRSFSYCLAMCGVLLVNPLSPIGAGFWLSFGAVGTLLLAFGARLTLLHSAAVEGGLGAKSLRIWQRWGEPQALVFVGMSVPLLVWTSQLSLFSPLANLFAIPLVSLLVVPIALLAVAMMPVSVASSDWLLFAANRLLEGLSAALQAVSHLAPSWGVWEGKPLTVWSVLFAALGTLLLLAPRGWPGRALVPVLLAPLLWPLPQTLPPGQARITVLDVGQGMAILVRTATHVLLYDTGPRFSADFDAGSGVVQPFLRSLGMRRLDTVVISHADNDHRGGLGSLQRLLEIDRLLMSGPAPLATGVETCTRGQSWRWDGVQFDMLYPLVNERYQGNNSSCVLRISAGGTVALLSGDIERAAEATLATLEGEGLGSHLLVAPHHGSQSSSTLSFLAAVRPRYVLVSAGYRSQFGHPAPQVAQRYEAQGIALWNTALAGALEFTLGTGEVDAPVQFRVSQQRYWYLEASEASRRRHGLCAAHC